MSGRYVLPSFTERTSYGIKEMNPYNKLFEDRAIFTAAQARTYRLVDDIYASRKRTLVPAR